VTFKADTQGLIGVVGFAQTFLFQKKSNGELSTGDTMYVSRPALHMLCQSIKVNNHYSEIFEVEYAPGNEHASGKKRVITKAFAAFGDMVCIPSSNSITRTSVAKGRVQKRSPKSHSVEARKVRSTPSKATMKKHRNIRNAK
jgi:hypothetical protein